MSVVELNKARAVSELADEIFTQAFVSDDATYFFDALRWAMSTDATSEIQRELKILRAQLRPDSTAVAPHATSIETAREALGIIVNAYAVRKAIDTINEPTVTENEE